MFKNYFILNRLTIELNKSLKGYTINRAFSFEKDKLVLLLQKDKEELIIDLSVNPGMPYLVMRKKFSVPKKNFVDFFSFYLPLTITSISIAENDRVIKINTGIASLYFTIRGKYTNLYLISGDGIESFKKVNKNIMDDFRNEILNNNFISDFNVLQIDDDNISPEILRKKYPVIGKEIINEIQNKNAETKLIGRNNLQEVLKNIRDNIPAVFIDESSNEVYLAVDSFNIFPFTRKEKFTELNEAFIFFLSQKFHRHNISDKKKIIEKHLERELNRTVSKLNDTKAAIDRGTKEEEYNKIGNLLLININNITKRQSKIELKDLYDENITYQVKLDPKLSPKQNVDLYFDKSRNEKIKYQRAENLLPDIQKKFSELQNIKGKFLKAQSQIDYENIMKDLKIKTNEPGKPADDIKRKFRHYIIQKKYNVYVGKDNKSNDILTLKFAKQNDYWFHARSVSGSHTLLKNENTKEGIPKNIFKAAASLAAYHSKAKTSGMVPVSYTQKKYVVKKKGMEAGKVALLKEEVLIVRPEIPAGCEYLSADSER